MFGTCFTNLVGCLVFILITKFNTEVAEVSFFYKITKSFSVFLECVFATYCKNCQDYLNSFYLNSFYFISENPKHNVKKTMFLVNYFRTNKVLVCRQTIKNNTIRRVNRKLKVNLKKTDFIFEFSIPNITKISFEILGIK